MDLCDKTKTCNAINYNEESEECVLKACPKPIPNPDEQESNSKGYAQISGKTLRKYILSIF